MIRKMITGGVFALFIFVGFNIFSPKRKDTVLASESVASQRAIRAEAPVAGTMLNSESNKDEPTNKLGGEPTKDRTQQKGFGSFTRNGERR